MMNSTSSGANRPQIMLAFFLACVCGCGTSYEMPKPKPLEHAAADTFTIRSFVVNGHEIASGNGAKFDAGEVPVRGSLDVTGQIGFLKGRPQPPIVHLQIVNEEGDRPVMADSAVAKLGARSARGYPFAATLKAPSRPGKYTLRVTAPPAKSGRNKSAAQSDGRPRIYAEGELTVASGD